MTVFSTNAPSFVSGIGASITSFLVKMIENSAMAKAADARGTQIRALEAKTDAELAEMKLERRDIVTHVFRDMMYV